jgi:hypothetical protein
MDNNRIESRISGKAILAVMEDQRKDIGSIKTDINAMKTDINTMKTTVASHSEYFERITDILIQHINALNAIRAELSERVVHVGDKIEIQAPENTIRGIIIKP